MASAGKNLKCVSPKSSPRMMSLALAMPGKNGMPFAMAALPKLLVRPGDTMNSAPAAIAHSRPGTSMIVPAPTIAPGTFFISAIASKAAAVRKVTSSTRSPPATSAAAISRACEASSMTSTGMTGAVRMIFSIATIWCKSSNILLGVSGSCAKKAGLRMCDQFNGDGGHQPFEAALCAKPFGKARTDEAIFDP